MFKQIDKRLNFNIFLQMFVLFTPLVQAAQMAIVIDDVGYRIKEDREILALPKAVSVAIIPVAPYATERAKDAYNQKRDILIHLPMEPKSKQPIEEGGIHIGDNEEKIRKLIHTSRGQVPYAIGLNNHMGSGATSDSYNATFVESVKRKYAFLFRQ